MNKPSTFQTSVNTSFQCCLVLGASVWIVLILFFEHMEFRLLFDDSYYYFEIAKNILKGDGVTFDGLNLTNGFHPLWLFLCILLYNLFDYLHLSLLISTQAVLVFQTLIWLSSLLLLAHAASNTLAQCNGKLCISRRVSAIHITLCILLLSCLFNPYVFKTFVNGMESTISLLSLSILALLHSSNSKENSHKFRFLVSCGITLLFISRTDAVLLYPLYALCIVLSSNESRLARLKHCFQVLTLPTLVTSLYLYSNYLYFGNPMQVSGLVKKLPLSFSNLTLFLSCILLGFVLQFRFSRQTDLLLLRTFARKQAWFFLFSGATCGYYLALQSFPRLWHFAPAILFALCLLLLFASNLLILASQDSSSTTAAKFRSISIILTAPVLLALVLQWKGFLNPNLVSVRLANYKASQWINSNLPEDDILTSWDAGIIGYFAKQSVINLDGVVNSHSYLAALKSRSTAEYLAQFSPGWIVNHDSVQNAESGEFLRFAQRYFGEISLVQIMKWPFIFSGSTNNSDSGPKEFAVYLYQITNKEQNPRKDSGN